MFKRTTHRQIAHRAAVVNAAAADLSNEAAVVKIKTPVGSRDKAKASVSNSNSKICLPVSDRAIDNRLYPAVAQANVVDKDFRNAAAIVNTDFRKGAIEAVVFNSVVAATTVFINSAFNKEISPTFIIRVPFADAAVVHDAAAAAVFTVR